MAAITGTNGDDVLNGTPDDDVIRTYSGNDEVYAGDGDDFVNPSMEGSKTIDGGAGEDWLDFIHEEEGMYVDLGMGMFYGLVSGEMSTVVNVENIYGSAFDDVLIGDSGDNFIRARDGDDVMYGTAGNDKYRGDQGFDTVDFSGSIDGVTVDLIDPVSREVSASQGFDSFKDIERIVGSAFADTLTANDDGQVFEGGDGDDVLIGRAGDDELYGGDGNDTISDGDGTDTVDAGDGDDTVIVGAGDGTYEGGAGVDTIDFSNQTASMDLDLRNTSVYMHAFGSQSQSGFENVVASQGGGRYIGTSGDNVMTGNIGDDRLVGVAGDDTFYGGDGDDTILPGIGMNTVDGGAGFDIVSYEFQTADLTLSLMTNTGFDTAMTGLIDDTYMDVEGLIGGTGDDFIEGDDNDNLLAGREGMNEIYGHGGNDTIQLGQGSNVVDGGDGIDLADYSTMTGRPFEITIAPSGRIIVRERESNVLIEELDNMESVRGSQAVDGIIIKSNKGHLVDGFGGRDAINSLAGSDVMIGGEGDDLITDSTGSDILVGGSGDDELTIMKSGNSFGEANLLFGGDGNDIMQGGETDDVLLGGDGDDYLAAGYLNAGATAGNQPLPTGEPSLLVSMALLIQDIFDGMGITDQSDTDIDLGQLSFSLVGVESAFAATTAIAGAAMQLGFDTTDGYQSDILDGGAGNDTLYGANENSVIMNGGEGDDVIDFDRARNFLAMGGEGNDVISGRVNNTSVVRVLDGGNGADVLTGTDANVGEVLIVGANGTATADIANGMGGDDLLIAHMDTGLSELTGGSGDDIFEIHDAMQTVTITDFTVGDDLIDLEVGGAIADFADLVANFLTAPDTISVGGLTLTLSGVDIAADLSDTDFIFA
mgnify:CR=1 FL=1